MRNLQEQVKKAFCCQKLFWPFTVRTNCCSDLKIFANSWPSSSNFKSFSRSLEQFFLTEGQNNFDNKIPFHQSFNETSMYFFLIIPIESTYLVVKFLSAMQRKFSWHSFLAGRKKNMVCVFVLGIFSNFQAI